MGDDSEWVKLPADEKVIHKVWKARVAGYEEAIKLFRTLDERSPEFMKFLGSLKKIATDNNAIAQEKGLDAILAFVENAHVAGKSCGEVMTALVTKCLNAARAKTKEKAMEIILMYIEIDKHETVQEELMKGLENKQPKIVYGCIITFRYALELFGPKVIQLKPIVKLLPKLLEDRDKTVREESKLLVIEVYRWIGAALKPQLANLKPVQLQELETEFENLPPGKPAQTRFMRSQQDLKAKAEAAAAAPAAASGGDEEDGEPAVEIDPLDLVDPVEIISKLPKNFYEQIEAKKWQERKEMLEVVEKLTESPKLLPGDYADLLRAVKKVLSKDTNVMLVAAAARCMCNLAKGLRKKFQPYAVQCNEAILAKFKEKKPMVVTALRDAIDAVFISTNLEAITEDILAALDDKNPNVKAETASFLARCFTGATTTTLNKKVLKPLIAPLIKTINDTAPDVRESSFTALGTAMKVVGEKAISAFLGDIDPIKMTKIKECCDKAELTKMKGKGAAPAAAAAPPAKPASKSGGLPPKKAAAPKSGGAKPAAGKPKAVKGGGGGGGGGAKGKKGGGVASAETKPAESLISDDIVEDKSNTLLGEENVSKLANPNWKERLAAMENIIQELKRTPKDDMPTQAITRIIGERKPGLKDTNFQVLKLRFSSLSYLAENFNFSQTSCECILADVVDKVGDVKNGGEAKNLLTAMSEATQFARVGGEVVRIAFEGKNPKTQAESLNWLSQAIYDFGFKLNIKPLIQYIKKGLSATNPSVRQSAITLMGVCYMYMGATLRVLFEDEKPALLAQIDSEFEKMKGQKPPTPTRGLVDAGDAGGEEEEAEEEATPAEDLVPRNDISDKISDGLLAKLGDKNWKIRKEGLDEVTTILGEAKFISANLSGLPEALKLRLADSNKILVTTTLGICKTIATASGQHCKRHVPILAGAIISTMGDSKPMIRQAACAALDSWVEQTKLNPFIEDGVFTESLRIENPFLRATLLEWLSVKLKDNQKKLPTELRDVIPPLLSCLGDRKPEVRKAAQDAILPFMMNVGYESMLKAASKLEKSSKDGVLALLEKTKGELPAKPKKVQSTPVVMAHVPAELPADDESGEDEPASAPKKTAKKEPAKAKGKAKAKPAPASSNKKNVPEDTTPIMSNTYTKAQRMKDEKNLKTLKWSFTQPRPEFIEQLRDQMEKNFGVTVLELLNHKDFQKHIKAIQMLSSALDTHRQETKGNIDLILRWFTLRFFETNPSMLNKALEYLLQLFEMLAEDDYKLTDNEANAFVPYLILKVGENKDNVRREVRKIINAICATYPTSKMFLFIMGGLASKNSKQRAECLEELGCMMERDGLGVCQPSPKEALKEIAKQISDRDNPVRSAALNTLVIAYQILGEQVYKYVGRLNDKDLGMLEERIKRAAKSKPAAPVAKAPSTPAGRGQRPATSGGTKSEVNESPPRPNTSGTVTKSLKPPSQIPAKYRIESEFLTYKKGVTLLPLPDDVDELLQPFPVPKMRFESNASLRPPSPSAQLLQGSSDKGTAIDLTVTNVASSDPIVSLHSLNQIETELSDSESELLSRVDQIVMMTTIQLKLIHNKHLTDSNVPKETLFKLYRVLLAVLLKVTEKRLLTSTPADVFKDFFAQLISSVLDSKLNDYPDGAEVVKSINWLLVNTLQNSNHTSTLCAGISLLTECVGSTSQSSEQFTELVLKCLWKKTRMLEGIINNSVLTFEPVLQLCHSFLVAYPMSTWKNRPSDKPVRTIKTLVSVMLQHAPDRVLKALDNVELGPKSELQAYIRKHQAKSSNKPANGTGTMNTLNGVANTSESANNSTVKMAKPVHDSLAVIFKKIGSKENSKEGLLELHLFREQNPEANLEPYLKKSSPFFQTYIERGLQSIEKERKKLSNQRQSSSTSNSSPSSVSHNQSPAAGDAEAAMWNERLQKIRQRMKDQGMSGSSGGSGSVSSPGSRGSPGSSGSLPRYDEKPPPTLQLDEPAELRQPISSPSSSSSRSELMDLKARLERIKRGEI